MFTAKLLLCNEKLWLNFGYLFMHKTKFLAQFCRHNKTCVAKFSKPMRNFQQNIIREKVNCWLNYIFYHNFRNLVFITNDIHCLNLTLNEVQC